MKRVFWFLALGTSLLVACSQNEPTLPVLGPFERVDGEKVYAPVRAFELLNQEGDTIRQGDLQGKIRIADFFFISCPTICPKLQSEMLRIRQAFSDDDRVVLLSHTIDPKRDSVAALAHYAKNLGVTAAEQWQFLTGNRDSIYELADDYFNIAVVAPDAPGGFDHSGRITVVDTAGYIRTFANGLDEAEVDALIENTKVLLNELDH